MEFDFTTKLMLTELLQQSYDNPDLGHRAQCSDCLNWNKGTPTCKAYPNGIPREILTNKVDHKNPYKGDNGIHFQEK